MNERKAVTRETRGEYRKVGKKEKGLILDQYVRLTGYNRKYAIRVLSMRPGKTATGVIDGKTVVFKAGKKPKPKNRLGKPVYTGKTVARIEATWRFYRYKRGSCLAELIRQNIDFLCSSRMPDFHITPAISTRLPAISGRQTGRLLKPDKDAMRLRGISGTASAASALLKKIPVRVRYTDEERDTPDSARQTRFTIAATPIRGNSTSPLPLPMPPPAGCGSTAC
ncbi:MAG: hypothetical protein LBF74_07980 [Treponema sp.]|jgi:hypothetical protein|nr:hypothetical protein [Treponema sp.]